jgi:hypothetical protein
MDEQRPCRTFTDAVIRLAPIPILATGALHLVPLTGFVLGRNEGRRWTTLPWFPRLVFRSVRILAERRRFLHTTVPAIVIPSLAFDRKRWQRPVCTPT